MVEIFTNICYNIFVGEHSDAFIGASPYEQVDIVLREPITAKKLWVFMFLAKTIRNLYALSCIISERVKKPFRKEQNQWITVQVANAVSSMVMKVPLTR